MVHLHTCQASASLPCNLDASKCEYVSMFLCGCQSFTRSYVRLNMFLTDSKKKDDPNSVINGAYNGLYDDFFRPIFFDLFSSACRKRSLICVQKLTLVRIDEKLSQATTSNAKHRHKRLSTVLDPATKLYYRYRYMKSEIDDRLLIKSHEPQVKNHGVIH